jgi:hypothetical protein
MRRLILELLVLQDPALFYYPNPVPLDHISITSKSVWRRMVERYTALAKSALPTPMFTCPDDNGDSAAVGLPKDEDRAEPQQSQTRMDTSGASRRGQGAPRRERVGSRVNLEETCLV